MSNGKVLLTTLSVRTSAKGRQYLSGWLGKASVVAFEGEPDKYGNPTWDLYLSEPEPREGQQRPAQRPQERGAGSSRTTAPPRPSARPGSSQRPFRRESAAARQERAAGEAVARYGGQALDDPIPF
jgi:hypothetical protein